MLLLWWSCLPSWLGWCASSGARWNKTCLLHMCSYSICWKILLTVARIPAASKDAQAFCPGISTPNWMLCVHTKLALAQSFSTEYQDELCMLAVSSCILVLPVWYMSCWMTFKVNSLLLLISSKNGLSDYRGKLNKQQLMGKIRRKILKACSPPKNQRAAILPHRVSTFVWGRISQRALFCICIPQRPR